MDMQGINRRHSVPTNASANVTATKPASSDDTSNPAPAANTGADTADTPATTSHVSPASRFMGFLQHLETEHPEQTKRVLNGIADRLHFDAKFAGPVFGNRLNDIADRFQKAADTGDLSNLVPQNPGADHHAMRAYQTAAGNGDATAAADAGAAVASTTANGSAPVNTSAPAGTTAPPATNAPADTTATAETAAPATTTTTTTLDTTTSDDAAAAALAAAGTPSAAAANTAANAPAANSGSDQNVQAAAIG